MKNDLRNKYLTEAKKMSREKLEDCFSQESIKQLKQKILEVKK
jgi:hypothetical protein